ncbi:MAG: cbb3-type cytochrome oxidase assembly protein CcoS [Ignavibacteriae bacterium]|nr:cbb3-type cytochrome oxidase assembly protein CcoS [Ignavibacteriota bacterium]
MSAIVVLLGLSILIGGGFLIAFIHAVRSGQYEDKYTPSVRMLFDESESSEENKTKI